MALEMLHQKISDKSNFFWLHSALRVLFLGCQKFQALFLNRMVDRIQNLKKTLLFVRPSEFVTLLAPRTFTSENNFLNIFYFEVYVDLSIEGSPNCFQFFNSEVCLCLYIQAFQKRGDFLGFLTNYTITFISNLRKSLIFFLYLAISTHVRLIGYFSEAKNSFEYFSRALRQILHHKRQKRCVLSL